MIKILIKVLLLVVCFNLHSQKIILSNESTYLTFADPDPNSTIERVRNYTSLMIGNKVFIGVETNDWKSLSGILAKSTRVNDNISIYSGISFKDKIRGYFINVNYNKNPCRCRRQLPIKYYIGVKSLTLKDISPTIGIRYKI